MTHLSPEQCRAARALIDWQQLDLAKNSRVSQKSIADFERGRTTPWPRTLEDLRRTFEAAGVVFLDDDGEGGVGVRMKAGVKATTRTATTGDGRSSEGGASGLSSLGWEDEEAEGNPLPADIKEDRAYWAAHPEAWERLSATGKKVLSRHLGL